MSRCGVDTMNHVHMQEIIAIVTPKVGREKASPRLLFQSRIYDHPGNHHPQILVIT